MTNKTIIIRSSLAWKNATGSYRAGIPAAIAILVIVTLGIITPARVSAQTFNDVPVDYWAFSFIETFARSGITAGCGSNNYCPTDPVTRAQMAVFLERGMRGTSVSLPAATGDVFFDVGSGDFAANFIEQLSRDGITAGCGGNNYCPADHVTRAQMAVFLLRAKHGSTFTPPPATGIFADAPLGSFAVDWIEQLAAEGITSGCGGNNFCPNAPISRDQMAVFLVRAFEIGFALTVTGVATDMPLANAIITGKVIHPDTNIEQFNTTANGLGNYTLGLATITQHDFVVLTAEGVGGQLVATLTSTVGSVGALRDARTSNSTAVSSGDFGALQITHITTAFAVLMERVNGGPITTDLELATAQAKVAGAELLNMASVIKTVIDNPGVSLPNGVTDTLALVINSVAFDAFVAELEINFPTELATAIRETADALQLGFAPEDVPGILYLAHRDELPLTGGTFVFDFLTSNTGSVVLSDGSSDISWSINAHGDIVAELLNPPVTQSFPSCNVPGAPAGQCRALTSISRITLIRLTEGLLSDQVIALVRRITTFPDEPSLPGEIVEDEPNPNNVFLAFRRENILPFTASELVNRKIATYYYHENNDSIGLSNPELGADFLSFDVSGIGRTSRRNFFFQWTIDTAGAIVITFINGDATAYARYSADGDVAQTVAVGSFANGVTKTNPAELIVYDGVSEFTELMLLNRRYRGLFALFDPDFSVFDFLFQSGGNGCRVTFAPPGVPIQWASTPQNTMDLFRFRDASSTVPAVRRSWEAVSVAPGLLGDRYWVIENADFGNSAEDPNFVFSDPTVTPGRINSYEFIEDLTGQVNPCGL